MCLNNTSSWQVLQQFCQNFEQLVDQEAAPSKGQDKGDSSPQSKSICASEMAYHRSKIIVMKHTKNARITHCIWLHFAVCIYIYI